MLRGSLHVKWPKIIQSCKDSPSLSVCVWERACHKYRFIKIFWGAQCCGKCKQVGSRDKSVWFRASGWLVSSRRAHVSSWHLFALKLFWVAKAPLGAPFVLTVFMGHRNVDKCGALHSSDNYSVLFPAVSYFTSIDSLSFRLDVFCFVCACMCGGLLECDNSYYCPLGLINTPWF